MNLQNIDMTKMKRDYIKNPLIKGKGSPKPIKGEIPFYYDLYFLYIENNVPRSQLLKYFNCSSTTFKRWCKKLKISKPLRKLEENAKEAIKNKYGVYNYSQTKMWKDNMIKNKELYTKRVYDGMRKNGFYGKSISKEEREIEKLLKLIYPQTQIQFISEKYPWKCDFFIPEIDTYIEYQGFWKHGPTNFLYKDKRYNCHCKYDKTNPIHNKVIKYWKSKHTKFYESAIFIWTKMDVLKRETAKKNNLNYLEFFDMNQFMEWYNNQGETNG